MEPPMPIKNLYFLKGIVEKDVLDCQNVLHTKKKIGSDY